MNRFFITTLTGILAFSIATPARAEITYTIELGGTGGGGFEDGCRPNDLLIGLNFSAGKALNTIQGV